MRESNYTCMDYRQEMVLLGLKRKLEIEKDKLSTKEQEELLKEIKRLEQEMDMN